MRIGIVVPVYRVKQEFLDYCVQSLINQTYTDIEIVLVDDCSPDNCGELCEEYAKMDKRIKVCHHTGNLGLPAARNSGTDLLASDTEWVMYVDSDDWIDLDTCEKLAHRIEKWGNRLPDIILYTGCRNYPELEVRSAYHYNDEQWFETYEEIEKMQIDTLSRLRKDYPAGTLNLDGACWRLLSVSFLRSKGISFIDVPYREDGLYFLYTTEQARRIVYIQEAFYHYRSTGDSMANKYRVNADQEHDLYLHEVWLFAKAFNKGSDFIRSLYYVVLLSMQICIEQKFFNNQNRASLLKKHKECKEFFSRKPYCDVFSNIHINELSLNHRIKGICIKYHCYDALVLLRNLYNKLRKQESF